MQKVEPLKIGENRLKKVLTTGVPSCTMNLPNEERGVMESEAKKRARQKYDASDKRKEARKRYEKSEKGKEARRRSNLRTNTKAYIKQATAEQLHELTKLIAQRFEELETANA